MPLAGQLAPILWHALERSTVLLETLCTKLGVTNKTAKEAVADDWDRMICGFACLDGDSSARQVFQDSVCELNRSRCRDVSSPHDALARLIFSGRVAGVISLN
jgi:hypothetical protein